MPALIVLGLVFYFVDPFIGDWDGLDYTMLSLAGYPSSMALGRNLFIFGNHALFRIANGLFHVSPENAYLVFKYAVVAQAPLAVIACWALAKKFTASKYSATVAALFVGLSPVFVLYGGQVMTDVPSVLLLAIALLIHWRGIEQRSAILIFIGAAILGLGVNLRETIGFYAPWLIFAPFVGGWKFSRREILLIVGSGIVFLLFALGWFAYWFITDPHYRFIWFGWRESMRQESARHPVSLQNLWPYLAYLFISGPLVLLSLPFAFLRAWRERLRSPLVLLAVIGLGADLLLFFNYSTAVNWRYFLTGLPALAPFSSDYLQRTLARLCKSQRIAFTSCVLAIALFAFVFGLYIRPISREFIERRALSKQYRQQLAPLPRDAVMISGAQTIAVTYWKAIGLGDWKTIGTGGGWPGENLIPEIENYMRSGRRVFLDSDPRWWTPCAWQRDEILAIVDLENRFNFIQVTDTIYELRFQSDQAAHDRPNLERLLPQNRPEDTRKCPPGAA